MKSMIIIGDIHGCVETLKALIAKFPKDIPIACCGDYIDRGSNSKEVVQLVIDNNYHCVRGNHEEMLLDDKGELRFSGLWAMNGGVQTYQNYINDEETKKKHMKWMETLPYYLEFPDVANDEGRYLVVSHSLVCNYWKSIKRRDINHDDICKKMIWDRPFILTDNKDIYNVIGHTPVNDPIVKSFYANIDTGCVFGKQTYVNPKNGHINESYGTLTAIQFPEMIIYQQDKIDIN